VIIHLDLDAFYAQVESRRLGIHTSTPLVVQQWRGIIAVNYAARAAGIKRHLTVDEAAKLCPGVVFVHVETIGDDEDEEDDEHLAEDHVSRDANDETKKNDATVPTDLDDDAPSRRAIDTRRPNDVTFARNDVRTSRRTNGPPNGSLRKNDPPPDRERRKVSLARYRRASVAVMETLADAFPDGAVERASVDEAYVDVTREVDANLKNASDIAARLITAGMEASGHVRSLRPEASVSGRAAGARRGGVPPRARRRFRQDRVHDVRRDRAQQDARQAGLCAEQAEQTNGGVSFGGERDARELADALDQRAGG
jgi:DNA polymerase eta